MILKATLVSIWRQQSSVALVEASQELFSRPKETLVIKSGETMALKYPLKSSYRQLKYMQVKLSFRETREA